MPMPRLAAARPSRPVAAAATLILASLVACSSPTPSPTLSAAPSPSVTVSLSPDPTASPRPTPLPTPKYTNPPDAALAALIPTLVAGTVITVPPVEEFALTPGDVAEAYGELGLRFSALQVAFVIQPRLSLYAVRVDPPAPLTADLEPYLATAGQYVGIAGLHREPWSLTAVGGASAWVRPEDDATAAGTMIYTWAADGYVFLLIGVDDELNRALIRELPGEPAPTPTPRPSRTPRPTPSPSGTAAEG
jgi:hypothetical protein